MKYITLVGSSRDIPEDKLVTLQAVGYKLAKLGYHGRSGLADGADITFFSGYVEAGFAGNFVNYLPWKGFRRKELPWVYTKYPSTLQCVNHSGAEDIAERVHPAWDRCRRGARSLHTRNVYQVLGADLQTPSVALYCYAKMDKHGDPIGGTRTAWMIAKERGIACKNLADERVYEECLKWLDK